MTLSQLIVQLQELQSQYSHLGDLEVLTYSVSGDDTIPVAGQVIYFDEDEHHYMLDCSCLFTD